jgi:hypothetical protein
MVKTVSLTTMVLVTAGLFLLSIGSSEQAFAADKDKPAKKPKAAPEAKAPKSKGEKPKYQTAESAGKAQACFGEAPKIEKLTPDEGKAGDKVTIKGSQLGSAACIRGVSFGPGNPAKFSLQNETTISATVPTGGRKGLAIVTVTTASGEDSKAFLLK